MNFLKDFYCIEGVDGSGKTTITKELSLLLPHLKILNEPTNGIYGSIIKKALKGEITLSKQDMLLLFLKDRKENQSFIQSYIKQGYRVFLDRYIISTMAYQGLYFDIKDLYQKNSCFFKPEIIFFIDVDPEISLERKFRQLNKEKEKTELFEKKSLQVEIYKNYKKSLKILEKNEYPIVVLNGNKPLKELVETCYSYLK